MTPAAVADVGNSRAKWGRVAPAGVVELAAFPHGDAAGWESTFAAWGRPATWAVCGVHPAQTAALVGWLHARGCRVLVVNVPFLLEIAPRTGLTIATREPLRTGIDRVVTALAARSRSPAGTPTVSICVGTAMTVDFVAADGRFLGGAILPGPRLMAEALHADTAALPRVAADAGPPARAWGDDTASAIEVGIAAALRGAADQLVRGFADRPGPRPWLYVTGGAADYFRDFHFTADLGFVGLDPLLTLDGVRLAAGYAPRG